MEIVFYWDWSLDNPVRSLHYLTKKGENNSLVFLNKTSETGRAQIRPIPVFSFPENMSL
jgi:hypothetical protein